MKLAFEVGNMLLANVLTNWTTAIVDRKEMLWLAPRRKNDRLNKVFLFSRNMDKSTDV